MTHCTSCNVVPAPIDNRMVSPTAAPNGTRDIIALARIECHPNDPTWLFRLHGGERTSGPIRHWQNTLIPERDCTDPSSLGAYEFTTARRFVEHCASRAHRHWLRPSCCGIGRHVSACCHACFAASHNDTWVTLVTVRGVTSCSENTTSAPL